MPRRRWVTARRSAPPASGRRPPPVEQAAPSPIRQQRRTAAYGRALADNGNSQAAFDVLGHAHSPANPDWRILSVQGTTLDKMASTRRPAVTIRAALL